MATGTGTLMAGRYRKLGPIGVGGMARVFLAEDERLGRRVAIKQLHAESPDEAAERFDREAKLGASLNHPNLVSIYDVASDSESVLIVMEYVDGKTLKDAIAAGPLDLARVVSIIHDVAAALNHAHAHGIVHRDVKPANILLRSDGMTKLADLGIATAAESTSITRSGMVLGTASYMAPEQLDGQKAGPASDIYSLAAVAFEAVSGRKAMTGETPMEIAHRVISSPPPDLREAWPDAPEAAAKEIARGMSRKPEDRPASAGEFATALHRGLRGAKGVAAAAPAAGVVAAAGMAAAAPAAEAAAEPAAQVVEKPAAPDPPSPPPPADLREEPPPDADPADAAGPAVAPPSERTPAPPPETPTRRAGADAPRASPRPARPSTYRPTRRRPSWLPAAGALAALCVIAIVAFAVLGGGGDEDRPSGAADRASQPDGGAADSKGDDSNPGKADGGSSSGAASGAGSGSSSGSGSGSGNSSGSAQTGAGTAGSTSQTSSGGTSAAALNDQGFRLMNQGRYKEAIPLLEKAVAQYPEGSNDLTYAFALYNLGKSLRLAGRPKEAVPILERRLRIPNQTATVRRELELARQAAG